MIASGLSVGSRWVIPDKFIDATHRHHRCCIRHPPLRQPPQLCGKSRSLWSSFYPQLLVVTIDFSVSSLLVEFELW